MPRRLLTKRGCRDIRSSTGGEAAGQGMRELRENADVLGLQALGAAGGLEFDLLVLLE